MLRLNIVVSRELMLLLLLLLYRVLVLHVEEYCSLEQTNLGVIILQGPRVLHRGA